MWNSRVEPRLEDSTICDLHLEGAVLGTHQIDRLAGAVEKQHSNGVRILGQEIR
jgi:hypothetical protein